MKTVLYSAPGRQDIVDGYKEFSKKFWPDCSWPIHALDGPTDTGWTLRLVRFLETETEPVLMFNGDDFWPFRKVEHDSIMAAYEHMLQTPSVVMTQLDYCYYLSETESYSPVPRFDRYKPDQPELLTWTGAGPVLVRADYYLHLAKHVLGKITPKQDVGWGGMLFFESTSAHEAARMAHHGYTTLVSRKVAAKPEDHGLPSDPVFGKLHTVRQGRWLNEAVIEADRAGIWVDFSKRLFGDGGWGDPYRLWQESRENP